MRIEPTVARMVWYVPMPGDALYGMGALGQALAAQIAHVNEDGTVNLGVLDRDGNHHARQRIVLAQDGADVIAGESYCTWMPYQTGQAAKTDTLEPRVASLETAVAETSASVKELVNDAEHASERIGDLAKQVAELPRPAAATDRAANSASPA